ncbi:hypothetical protein ACGFNV_14430 [Streptomyces sp. NPDC048751]|uniref:hypothetical protein n=1 Tax=Streptomyces sp. NPDC048751 TaxID=3365591 RepID=UPI00371C9E35
MRRITATVEATPMLGDTPTPLATSVLELLPLPEVSALSESQRRGATCAWGCGSTLTAETARDLGEQPGPDGGAVFLRGCVKETARHAMNALFDHTPLCEQCVDKPDGCDLGTALRRLTRGGWL